MDSASLDRSVEKQDLAREWLRLAPAWIREARQGRNPTRCGLLDQPMLEACGAVRGLKILDCGCGEGRFCRLLVEHGAAYALGLDLCPPMIAAAKKLASGNDEYQVANVQDLGFLEDGLFELAISYLNQCDLPDFRGNTREVYRVLAPGGRFIIANLHPMRSAQAGWQRAEDGRKLHVMLDHYFDEGERQWTMLDVKFTNYHRTLQTYIDGFHMAGFALERIVEPTVTPKQLHHYPELEDELRVPNFIIYVLRKPDIGASEASQIAQAHIEGAGDTCAER